MSRRPRFRAVVLLSGGDLGWMESRNIAVLGFNTGAYLSSFTHDHYLPAKAARALFGPDGARRQRHAIEARDHSFSDARSEMYNAVETSIQWIERPALPTNSP